MKDRYIIPAQKTLDSNLRGMGFAPQGGPVSRLFVILLAYSVVSKALVDAATSIIWVRDNVRCHPSRNAKELKQCLYRFCENFFKALTEDSCGWAPVGPYRE